MDPTLSIDGPMIGPEPAEDETLLASTPDELPEEDLTRAPGPGDGDARVMAWARAM